ncbi:autotransporter family protein, partial [Undibacterium luofuense]
IILGNSLTNAVSSTLTGGSYGAVTYTSSNPAVATVDAAGKVTTVSAGTVTITATQAAVVGVNVQATQSYSLTVVKNVQAALVLTADKTAIYKNTGKATISVAGGSGSGAVTLALTSGNCSLSGNVLSAGTTAGNCVVTATKAADATYNAASGSITIQVQNLTVSSVSLAATQTQVMESVPVTLSASVNPASSTGSISFMDGAVKLATVPLNNGTASFVTKDLAVGSHSITASYSGDATTDVSTSTAVVITVGKRPDPSNNAVVKSTAVSAVSTSQRFVQAQLTNMHSHFQVLHHDFAIRNRFDIGLNAPNLNMVRMAADKIAANLGSTEDTSSSGAFRSNPVRGPAATPETARAGEDGADNAEPKHNEWFRIGGKPVGIWTAGNIDFGGIDGDNNNRVKFSSSGLTVGMDMMWNPKLIVGASVGYGRDKTTMDNLGSESKSRLWSGTLYGVYKPEKDWFVDVTAGGGQVSFDNQRWDEVNQKLLTGDRTGETRFVSLALLRDVKLSNDLYVQPFGRFDWMYTRLHAYNETGSLLALTMNEASSSMTAVTGGLTLSKDYYFDFGQLTPSMKLQWRHRTSGSMNQSMYYTDLGASSTNYNVVVIGLPEDIQSLGFGLYLKNRRGFVAHASWLGSMGAKGYRANSFNVDLRFGF